MELALEALGTLYLEVGRRGAAALEFVIAREGIVVAKCTVALLNERGAVFGCLPLRCL